MRAVIRRVAVVSALICIVTAALAVLYDPWAATAVGVVWTVAVIVFAARFRLVEPGASTPPRETWPVITPLPHVGPPPPHRADEAVVIAAIDGHVPPRRLISRREKYQIAVACTHERQSPEQVARLLRCSEADVGMLLAIAEPLEAVSR